LIIGIMAFVAFNSFHSLTNRKPRGGVIKLSYTDNTIISSSITSNGINYNVYTITQSTTITVVNGLSMQILAVGGGGGGGYQSGGNLGGGGGGGGKVFQGTYVSSSAGNIAVTIGNGGLSGTTYTHGGATTLSGVITTITAPGGTTVLLSTTGGASGNAKAGAGGGNGRGGGGGGDSYAGSHGTASANGCGGRGSYCLSTLPALYAFLPTTTSFGGGGGGGSGMNSASMVGASVGGIGGVSNTGAFVDGFTGYSPSQGGAGTGCLTSTSGLVTNVATPGTPNTGGGGGGTYSNISTVCAGGSGVVYIAISS
jgi:fibronectin-binding autotransporter adhesin